MRKSTKLLSVLLVVCMLISLMPMGVLAAEPTGPKKAAECMLGDPGAAWRLNIVNDAATTMLYEVKVNDKTETLTLAAGETLSVGIGEGDRYQVAKIGNSNYNLLSESASFQSGDYEAEIANTFSHRLGDGFKVGEEYIFKLKDGTLYEGETTSVNGKNAVAETVVSCPVTLSTSRTAGSGSFTLNGVQKTATVNANYTVSGTGNITSDSTAKTRAANLQTAINNLFTAEAQALPGYDASTWEIVGTTINYVYSNGLFGIGRSVSFSAEGNLMAYQPLSKEVVDIVDPLELGDITLTFTTEVDAKTGSVELNVLNGERLGDINSKINAALVANLMGVLTAGNEGGSMSMDSFTQLLSNPDLQGLMAIEALDNMPKGYAVTLTEVDKHDGLYEGLSYTVPMTETMFIDVDVDYMLRDALGSFAYGLASGMIPAELKEMKLTLPVSIGQSFALEGVRTGDYTLTVTSPGEGWIPAAQNTFSVKVSDGGVVSGIGGNHIYGSIPLRDLVGPMTSAIGMNLGGCGNSIGSGLINLLTGGGNVKMVNTNGVVFNHVLNHIEFTNAALNVNDAGQVQTTGLPGATFMLIDRDRFNALLDSMLALGGAVINSVIGGIQFDELLGLKQEINDGDGGEIEAEPGMIERVLTSVLALGDRLGGLNLPPILESVADENGLVTFDPQNNVTLQKLIDLIPKLMDAVNGIGNLVNNISTLIPDGDSDATEPAESGESGDSESAAPAGTGMLDLGGLDMDSILQLLGAIAEPDQIGALMGLLNSFAGMAPSGESDTPAEPADPAEPSDPEQPAPDMMEVLMNMLQEFGGGDLGFAALNILGLSDGRFPTSNYILIQTAVPDGRVRNPMMYVFQNTWNAEDGKYHTYANMDLAGVMSNEQFALFAEKLAQSYVVLEDMFAGMASAADNGLSVMRAFIGEGDSYNTRALFDHWDAIVAQIFEQIQAQQAAEQDPASSVDDGEVPGDTEIADDGAASAEPETSEDPAPVIPQYDIKGALADIIDQTLNTFVPKAAVLSYASNLIYRLSGGMFDSQQEAADLLVGMTMNEDLTFSNFNAKIQKVLSDARFVLNGEVTRNWYYYDVNLNIFTNVNVAYHYILNEMLPPELASVIERALQGGIDKGEEMVDVILDKIENGCAADEPAVPENPDPSEQPEQPDTPASTEPASGGSQDQIGGLISFIGNLLNPFKWH